MLLHEQLLHFRNTLIILEKEKKKSSRTTRDNEFGSTCTDISYKESDLLHICWP